MPIAVVAQSETMEILNAKNHDHAEFIGDRFNANYPHYKGEFARVIDFQVKKIPARRAEYSLTENVASPFQAEPTQLGQRRFYEL